MQKVSVSQGVQYASRQKSVGIRLLMEDKMHHSTHTTRRARGQAGERAGERRQQRTAGGLFVCCLRSPQPSKEGVVASALKPGKAKALDGPANV